MSKIKCPEGLKSLCYQLVFDFIISLKFIMKTKNISRRELANKLNITEDIVNQKLDKPSNMTLQEMITWAAALDLKVSVVAYDDNDPDFKKLPVFSQVFTQLWEIHGQPKNFDQIDEIRKTYDKQRLVEKTSKVS